MVRGVCTNDEGTMAFETARKRWPVVVEQMITDMDASVREFSDDDKAREGKQIIEELRSLKSAISQDRNLVPLQEDGRRDIAAYNSKLKDLGAISWHAAPWLYAECYMYRRIQTLFANSRLLQSHDLFARQKNSTFAASRLAVEELAGRFNAVVSQNKIKDEAKARLLFEEMVHIALWGNATDLSLLSNLSLEEIQNLQGSEAIKRNEKNIVDNDIDQVWKYLLSNQPLEQVDIVLDNSGFEYFTDLVFATYLLHQNLARKIVLHVKDFPWFVSDVTPLDVKTTMEQLKRSDVFPNREAIEPFTTMLEKHFDDGSISTRQSAFWTTYATCHELPTVDPQLHEQLLQSSLIIFKGDLNYRKLTCDGLWPYTTTFAEALGPLADDLKILALRTNKADVCVGLHQEQLDKLDKEVPGSAWVRNGKYAVISFSMGE